MSDTVVPGIHHVTALSGAAQEALDFYVGVLGLRLTKKTVNFDDPMTHHLYFSDTVGRPGTVLTFFPWPEARLGRAGAGMAETVSFAVPEDALGDWQNRLDEADVGTESIARFGEEGLQFEDPAGLSLEVMGTDVTNETVWTDGCVPADAAIRGVHAPVLPVFSGDETLTLFTDVFGWNRVAEDGNRVRLQAPEGGLATSLDLKIRDRHPSGGMGRGTVHHLAFRAPDDEAQKRWQTALRDRGVHVTDVKDRYYFRSIYFRDSDWTSGILFEIATDAPGFLADEEEDRLGQTLQLPPWLQDRRDEIEDALPSLSSPSTP